MSRCSTRATSTSGGRGDPAAEVALVQLDTVRAAAIRATAPEVSNPLLNSVLIFSPLEDRFAVSSARIDGPSFAPPLARRVDQREQPLGQTAAWSFLYLQPCEKSPSAEGSEKVG